MTIELLGDNCRRCRLLQGNIERALQGCRTKSCLRLVEDPQRFAEYGLLSLPGLVIDGKVVAEGRLPSVEEIRGLFAA